MKKCLLILMSLTMNSLAWAGDDFADFTGKSSLHILNSGERLVTVEGDVAKSLYDDTTVLIDFQTHNIDQDFYTTTIIKTHETATLGCFRTQKYERKNRTAVEPARYSCALTLSVD